MATGDRHSPVGARSSALEAELSDAWLSSDDLAFLDGLGRDLGELDKVAQLGRWPLRDGVGGAQAGASSGASGEAAAVRLSRRAVRAVSDDIADMRERRGR